MAEEDDAEKQTIESVMGFSGFGKKAAMHFDVEKMFAETRRSAQEYTQSVAIKKGVETGGAEGVGEGGEMRSGDSSDDDDDIIGPPLPPGYGAGGSGSQPERSEEGESEEDDEEDNSDFLHSFPLSHEVKLEHGDKPVSALGMDPSGARVISGGYDYTVRLWDFAGMDSRLKSFRSITPCESHRICTLQYSITGDAILVASGSAQAKVLDRDGHNKMQCPKGWQYIIDMTNTKGHVSMINCACWHPKIKETFLTCSNDCTLRLWDVNEKEKQLNVIKGRDKKGRKSAISTCTFSKDGKMIAAGLVDGSIQLWKSSGPFTRSSLHQYTAHTPGTETSCITMSHDNQTLVSRER
ncbi:WD repeat-containing protein 70 [Geodia barretti]|uniref:WD repeat-containing protein 70 n=1 Tax=Geodia barretti TaxID=519541 RepID=A0AA35WHG3_GEOBA|nr:WD repeat-containing protein 70 [Geodia barretti]